MKKMINLMLEEETLKKITKKIDNLQYNTRSEFIRKAIFNELERRRNYVKERNTKD